MKHSIIAISGINRLLAWYKQLDIVAASKKFQGGSLFANKVFGQCNMIVLVRDDPNLRTNAIRHIEKKPPDIH